MRKTHKVTITDHGPGLQKVVVDDLDISSSLSRVRVTTQAGQTPEVDLDFRIIEVKQIDLEHAELFISHDIRTALIKLGWTPPQD